MGRWRGTNRAVARRALSARAFEADGSRRRAARSRPTRARAANPGDVSRRRCLRGRAVVRLCSTPAAGTAYPPSLGDTVMVSQEAVQLSRSVWHWVRQLSSLHFLTQLLSTSWQLALQSLA